MVNFPEDYAKQEKYYASESYQTYTKTQLTTTERDRRQAIITAYSGAPKKGDYIPGNKGTGSIWNGEKWVHHGQGSFKAKSAGGKEYFTDARFDEAVNNLDPEAWRNLAECLKIFTPDDKYY